MSLRLDHVNGDNTDNRLVNLRIVCPNCDATLSTFSGRNIKNKPMAKVDKKKKKLLDKIEELENELLLSLTKKDSNTKEINVPGHHRKIQELRDQLAKLK